jgi:antitoxin component of MazEF toxin-antitoxin module
VRISPNGEVTIPAHVREQAGLLPDTEVRFHFDGECIRILPVTPPARALYGDELIRSLSGRATTRLSSDQILALMRGET